MKVVTYMKLRELFDVCGIDPMIMMEKIVEEETSSVILFKNKKSEIVYANQPFFHKHQEFQDNPSSIYGKTDFDLFPHALSHAKQAFADEQQVMKTGKAINVIESEGTDQFGRTIIAHTKKYPVYNHCHEVIGTFIITEDMTNDIATLRENQEKNDLLTKLNYQLTKENTTDSLSGLYNRRFIRSELDYLYQSFQDEETPFSVILLDLDNFKRINDEFGHAVGDEVISYVGTVLLNIKRQLYPTMEPCRYGGDEFLVILPTYQREGARAIAKSIKDAFDQHIFSYEQFHETIGMSIGVASMRKEDKNVHALLERCDHRLYLAKKNGKNQISY